MSEIPAWCLLPVLEELDPVDIGNMALTNSEIANVCTSQAFWKDKYDLTFQPATFKISKEQEDFDWVSKYGKRQAISFNIANHKPKAKSFKGSEVNKVRNFSNSFAFTSKDSLSIVAYEYFDKGCEYENVKTFPVQAKDFIFVDADTIITVNSNVVSMIKLSTGVITKIQDKIGDSPMIHALSSTLFAIVTDSRGYIYDTRDVSEPKCSFKHVGAPIALESRGRTLFVATQTDLSAHDVSNPRGPILWNVARLNNSPARQCSFNIKAGYALYDNAVVLLLSGKVVARDIARNVTCSAVINKNIAIVGSEMQVIYYDFKKGVRLATQTFGEDEQIKYICSSSLNSKVAIAGDFTVHIVEPHYKDGNFVVDEVRTPLKCGSIGMRRLDNFGIMKQVLFDGERLVANMGDFVRVYDFYTGNAKDVKQKK